jgi:hypothetical protein
VAPFRADAGEFRRVEGGLLFADDLVVAENAEARRGYGAEAADVNGLGGGKGGGRAFLGRCLKGRGSAR